MNQEILPDNGKPVTESFHPFLKGLSFLKKTDSALPKFNENWLTAEPKYTLDRKLMETIKTTKKKKNTTLIFSGAAAALLIVGLAGILVLRTNEEKKTALKAVVLYVNGDASLHRAGKPVKKLFTGDVVVEQDVIKTSKTGTVEISLIDKTAVRLKENTSLSIKDLYQGESGRTNVNMELNQGSTFNIVNRLSEEDNYVITTPTAIASVRGTNFEVTFASDNKETIVHLSEGAVQVRDIKRDTSELLTVDQKRVIRGDNAETDTDKPRTERNAAEYTSLQNHINGIDDEVMKSVKSIKEIKTEKELIETYKQNVEIYKLVDGRELRGVVVSQSNGKMVMHSIDGVFVFNENEVLNAHFVEESVTEPKKADGAL